jgi:hypothetical protein
MQSELPDAEEIGTADEQELVDVWEVHELIEGFQRAHGLARDVRSHSSQHGT